VAGQQIVERIQSPELPVRRTVIQAIFRPKQNNSIAGL